jgi:hypothetical protein
VEKSLETHFAFYLRDLFPGINEVIRQRLASTMLLRRKRILYRRSRYGQAHIELKKRISQPKVTLPLIQPQTSNTVEELHMSAKSIMQSVAVTTTTLDFDKFKKASAPSIISASKTVALSNHQDLIFPPPPDNRIKQKYKKIKRQREEDYKRYLESLQSLFPADSKAPAAELHNKFQQETSEAEAQLQETLDKDWDDCVKAIAEVTCPFCFYALPSLDIIDEKKWKYVNCHSFAAATVAL